MDNILKTILAVIGISGLIALVMSDMPSPIDKESQASANEGSAVTAPNAPAFEKSEPPKPGTNDAPAIDARESNAPVTQSQSTTVDPSTFGQPMMNPEPAIKFPETSEQQTNDSVSDGGKPVSKPSELTPIS